MPRKRRKHLNSISDFKNNIEFIKETYGKGCSFKVLNTSTQKVNLGRTSSMKEVLSITKFDTDFFNTFLDLFIESFNVKDSDKFNEKVCNFFCLEEFQKCLSNTDFLKVKFFCNEECLCIDGICENLLTCKNYEKDEKECFLEITSSQNLTNISITKINSKHNFSLSHLEYDSLSFLAYFKYFLNDLEILVKDENEEEKIKFHYLYS
ncbi:hypothetical protein [Cetobacterium sp.]|uniref:hypothetical protein n=1 Tax=Cetobacterium sp. TaxID=2071632 RepID=UPI003F31E733